MMRFFSLKALQKVECLFLEDDKIVLTSNTFFVVVSLIDSEGCARDSADVLGRQCVGPRFAFEANALLDAKGLGKVNQETLDSLSKKDR